MLGGVDSQGLEVNALTGSEVVVELLLSLLQVGNSLVVGGINFTLIQRAVGQIVVGEFLNVDIDSRVLCQVVLDVLEDLRVWRGACSNGDGGCTVRR